MVSSLLRHLQRPLKAAKPPQAAQAGPPVAPRFFLSVRSRWLFYEATGVRSGERGLRPRKLRALKRARSAPEQSSEPPEHEINKQKQHKEHKRQRHTIIKRETSNSISTINRQINKHTNKTIYIYIYIIYIYIYISINISISLSLYIYIYIYIYTFRASRQAAERPTRSWERTAPCHHANAVFRSIHRPPNNILVIYMYIYIYIFTCAYTYIYIYTHVYIHTLYMHMIYAM